LVFKALDPDWIRIRIGVHPKMLDPDPEKINTDPQPCHKGRLSYRRSLQLSKENIQHFRTIIFSIF
jgi:hypothetical protein